MKEDISEILKNAFSNIKKTDKSINVRSISKKINISPSFLSLILNGKRNLPIGLVDNICSVLDVDQEQKDYIVKLLLESSKDTIYINPSKKEQKRQKWSKKSVDNFSVLDCWYLIPVLECTRLSGYDGTTRFVERKLGLSTIEVERAFELLKANSLLKVQDGILVKEDTFLDFSSASSKKSLRNFHKWYMQKSITEMDEKTSESDLQNRLIKTFIIALNHNDASYFKMKLNKFILDTMEEISVDNLDCLYHVGLQIVPIDKK